MPTPALHVTFAITDDQADFILAVTRMLGDDDPLKNTITTAIAFARRRQSVETQTGEPGQYVMTQED